MPVRVIVRDTRRSAYRPRGPATARTAAKKRPGRSRRRSSVPPLSLRAEAIRRPLSLSSTTSNVGEPRVLRASVSSLRDVTSKR